MRHWIASIIYLFLAFSTACHAADSNPAVLEAAQGFADGGGYREDWSGGTGSPVEVKHKGAVIVKKDDGGTYCNGFTFATVIKVVGEAGLLNDKTVAQLRAFQRTWYGTTRESAEEQCAKAVGELGVGRKVSADEAKAGDFVQFWRSNNTGHSAVFLGWIEEEGKRVGLRYRSSQGSTNGIGDMREKFEANGGKVKPARIYFGRLDHQ